MKQGQRLSYQGHDVALFPMEFLKVTQPPTQVGDTHEGTMNIDLAGIDGGISNFYAPYGWKVVQNNNTKNHEIIWWSLDKVHCKDGDLCYLSARTLHDDDVSDLWVGRVFTQGELCTQEGNTGDSHGNHVHMCVAKGHTTRISVKSSGYRDLVGSVDPSTIFYVNGTTIGNTMGMNWGYYKEPIETPIVIETPQPEPEIIIVPVVEPEPIPEPVEPVSPLEPVQEPLPPVEQVIDEVPNVAPEPQETVTEPCTPVQPPQTEVKLSLLQIILNIIKILLTLLKGKI